MLINARNELEAAQKVNKKEWKQGQIKSKYSWCKQTRPKQVKGEGIAGY